MVAVRGWVGMKDNRELLFTRYRVSVPADEKVLEMDNADGKVLEIENDCTTL